MDTTLGTAEEQFRNGARRVKQDVLEGISQAKDAASGEIKKLMEDVEDLVARVADLKDPEISKIRSKVQHTLASARNAVTESANKVRDQAEQVAGRTDDFVRENPWQALGIAALLGVAVGFLVARRD
jgi:ElaB/YqjD/DUF883 family membrane-anchored ribosome-binding protein